MNRGAWIAEEDKKLLDYVRIHGDKNWRTLPQKAGLNRCGKSCRLRWLNYLRPGIKRGNISEEEDDLIIRLHNLLGNRWSLIARRLPGRTDNEIKNYWNAHLSKRALTIHELNRRLHCRSANEGSAIYRSGRAALGHPVPVRPSSSHLRVSVSPGAVVNHNAARAAQPLVQVTHEVFDGLLPAGQVSDPMAILQSGGGDQVGVHGLQPSGHSADLDDLDSLIWCDYDLFGLYFHN